MTEKHFPQRPSLFRSSTQPMIIPQSDDHITNARLFQGPIQLHDDSFSDINVPSEFRPSPFGAQGDPAQSYQKIPAFHRATSASRCNDYQPKYGDNSPQGLPTLVAFRQDSIKGSRIVRVPSNNELNELENNRPPLSAFSNQNNNGAVVIPVLDAQPEGSTDNEAGTHETGEVDPGSNGQQNPNLVHEEDSADRAIIDTAKNRVKTQQHFNIFIFCWYIIGFTYAKGVLPATAVFAFAIASIILYDIYVIWNRGLSSHNDKVDIVISLLNSSSILLYLCVALTKQWHDALPLVPFSIFGIFVLFAACCKNSLEQPGPAKVFSLIIKTVIWVELFLVGLRVDGVDMPWTTAFIPLYFTLMLLAFSSLLIITGSLFAFIGIIREEGFSFKLLAGSVWYILNAFYIVVWLGILTQLINKLDDDEGEVFSSLKVGFAHSGILLLYTFAFRRVLYKFQEFEVQSEMLVADMDGDANLYGEVAAPPTYKFQASKEERADLVMISPTFYTYIQKHMKNRNNENNIEALKTNVLQAKLGKQRQMLTMNQPHNTDIPGGVKNQPVSPTKRGVVNLDYSDGDIKAHAMPPANSNMMIKRSESTVSGENLCTICFDSVPNAVLMDCGHGGICYECALENWKKTDNCLLCRQKINKVLKIVNCKPLGIVKVVESTRKMIENA